MSKMSFTKKTKYGLAVTAMLGTMVGIGSSLAYFSSQQQSGTHTFKTGTLQLDLIQTSPLTVTNWQPGESKTIEFTVKNSGELPLHAKAEVDASWSDTTLSNDLIQITTVERWLAGNWLPVTESIGSVDEPVFLSTDGTESTLLTVSPSQQEKFRLVVQLSTDAGNEYQGQVFSGSVVVHAKQITQGASW